MCGPAPQRRHDALEEACRRLIGAGCLPDRAGQPTQVQLHLTLEQLRDLPGATDAEAAWRAGQSGQADPAAGQAAAAAQASAATSPTIGAGPAGEATQSGQADPAAGQAAAAAQAARAAAEGQAGWPTGRAVQPTTAQASAATPPTSHAAPAGEAARAAQAARAAAEGQPGWLTGRAAQAYACDAAITPIVTGTVDRAALAAVAAELLAGLADGCTCGTGAASRQEGGGREGGYRNRFGGDHCRCADTGPPGRTGPTGPPDPRAPLHPTALARLHQTLLRHAADLLSGPTGLAAFLRTRLTGDQFPSVSLPLDTGTPASLITGGASPCRHHPRPALRVPWLRHPT